MSIKDHPAKAHEIEVLTELDFTPRCEVHETLPAVWIMHLPVGCTHLGCNACRSKVEAATARLAASLPAGKTVVCLKCHTTHATPLHFLSFELLGGTR